MQQTTHFFNLGYGWLCKHCSAEEAERRQREHSTHNKDPHDHYGERQMKNLALARWNDEEHHGLTCPRCGIEEQVTRI